MTDDQLHELRNLISSKKVFQKLMLNESPKSLDPDPWVSNYAYVTKAEDEYFCRRVAEISGEGYKVPRVVALMRSVDDPEGIVSQFHNIHIDSRHSDKTLIVLEGTGEYPIFACTGWSDFTIIEKLEIQLRTITATIIEKLKIRSLQFKFTGKLPERLEKKVYSGTVYYDNPGAFIKFNNMLPHHSHIHPTQFSVLLQIVYT